MYKRQPISKTKIALKIWSTTKKAISAPGQSSKSESPDLVPSKNCAAWKPLHWVCNRRMKVYRTCTKWECWKKTHWDIVQSLIKLRFGSNFSLWKQTKHIVIAPKVGLKIVRLHENILAFSNIILQNKKTHFYDPFCVFGFTAAPFLKWPSGHQKADNGINYLRNVTICRSMPACNCCF